MFSEELVQHIQFKLLCISAVAAEQISWGHGFTKSVNKLQTPSAAAGVFEMCLTSGVSSCSAVAGDAFPLLNRKRVSVRCDGRSLPWPAAPCRALFGTHNYLLVMHIYCTVDGVLCL